MFFSLSLATYYTLSSLIRNRQRFICFGRAHYILPAGSFGRRPPFKDHKRKPSSREFPIEDTSLLLCIAPVPTLFLDELHKNFLDLTLIDQRRLFVDCLLKALEDCLHRGLDPNINDVGRLHSLDTQNDPNTTFRLEGYFGIPILPPGRSVCDGEITNQPTIAVPGGSSTIVSFQQQRTPSSSVSFINIRQAVRFNFDNIGSNIYHQTPSDSTTYPPINAAYHQSLPVAVFGCAKYPRNSSSAPATFRLVLRRESVNTTVSFCQRGGQHISYRSIPVTIRVTKISLATKRKCVSLTVCHVNRCGAFRRGLENGERRNLFRQSVTITSPAGNADKGPSSVGEALLPLQSSRIAQNVPVKNPTQRLDSNRSLNAVTPNNPSQANRGPTAPQCCLNISNRITSPTPPQKIQGTSNNNNVKHRPLPVSRQWVTQAAPASSALPLTNQMPGGKAAAAPPSKTGFAQHNQQTGAAKKVRNGSSNQHPMVAQPTLPGQHTSNSGTGAVGANNFGQANVAGNLYDPFGWGPTPNLGVFQQGGTVQGRGPPGTLNPVPGVIGGAINRQTSPFNRNRHGQQAVARATAWNTSKPCSQGRNSGATSYHLSRQNNSHGLLMSRTPSQSRATLPCNNNFGWGATQQAAGPGFMLWGASHHIPKALSVAVPIASKSLSIGPSIDNSQVTVKYNVPSSCPVIPWSDLEDVIDRRNNKPKILGSGCFGIVKLMKIISSGKLCAVKINQDDVDEQIHIESLQSEIDILTTLKNLDCVPELFGVTKPPGNKSQLPVVVQEFIGDPKTFRSITLLIAIEAKVLPAPKATRVALRICEAVKDIQKRKLLHCDLKTDNIMLEPGFVRKVDPKIKIIDFGMSEKMDDKPQYQHNSRDEIPWMLKNCWQFAPEVVRGEKPYNVSSEIWSLGMIFKDLSCRFEGFLYKLGKDCTKEDYRLRPSLEDVIQKIKTHLASNP